MIIQLTPVDFRAKSKGYEPKKSQEIDINFTITDCSNFEKRHCKKIVCHVLPALVNQGEF